MLVDRVRLMVLTDASLLKGRDVVEVCRRAVAGGATSIQVRWKPQIAGSNGRPSFTLGALWRIYSYSQGIPRLVNAVCDKCLLAGFVHRQTTVDHHLANVAIRELEGKINV